MKKESHFVNGYETRDDAKRLSAYMQEIVELVETVSVLWWHCKHNT